MIYKSNWRPLPSCITVKESKIEGLGLFALKPIAANTDLGISHIFNDNFPDGYIRLPLGGFVNHHEIPNSKAVFSNHDEEVGDLKHIRLVTQKQIQAGEEITIKYVINRLENPNWETEYEITQ